MNKKSLVAGLVQKIQREIQNQANEKTRIAIEKYMKGVDNYRGVKSGDIKSSIFKEIWSQDLKQLEVEDQKEIAHELMKQGFGEDKYVAGLIFEKLKGSITLSDIQKVENLFNQGSIVGWANTDCICGVLFKHWAQGNVDNVKYICAWKDSKCIWLQRASCVTFVTLAKYNDKKPNFKGFIGMLLETCETTIQNQERFVQLGTGWLLRNIGIGNKTKLLDFIETNYEHFTREGLRYAIEKLDAQTRKNLMCMKSKSDTDELAEEADSGVKKKKKK